MPTSVKCRKNYERAHSTVLEKGSVLHFSKIELATVGPCSILLRMARELRLQYPDAIYHAMNRGDRREAIFWDDVDRKVFLESLSQACEKTGWQQLGVLAEPSCQRGTTGGQLQ